MSLAPIDTDATHRRRNISDADKANSKRQQERAAFYKRNPHLLRDKKRIDKS